MNEVLKQLMKGGCYLPLGLAAKTIGCTEDELIRLGIAGKLNFYVEPKNWAYLHMDSVHVTRHIYEPMLLNVGSLKELHNGVKCIMYSSDEFPDSTLVDLDDEPDIDEDADYSSDPFGLLITKDRLVIKSEDLAPFLPKQHADVLLESGEEAEQDYFVVQEGDEVKPWLIADPKDPDLGQPWYTPARYFARKLVEDDSTLLVKRKILAEKVARSLYAAGFKNRSKKQYDPGTVLKAFSNVSLS